MNAALLQRLYATRRRLQNEGAQQLADEKRRRAEEDDQEKWYHGTTKSFDKFSEPKFKNQQLGFGIHFTKDPEFAAHYTTKQRIDKPETMPGANIRPSRLLTKKTLDTTKIHDVGTPEHEFAKELHKGTGRPLMIQHDHEGKPKFAINLDVSSPKRVVKLLQKHGYDSVHYDATIAHHTAYGLAKDKTAKSMVVLHPDQVKSAFEQMMYHGAPPEHVDKIHVVGLQPFVGKNTRDAEGCDGEAQVCLTADKATAKKYAGRGGTVFSVELDHPELQGHVPKPDGHEKNSIKTNQRIPPGVLRKER